MSFIGRHPDSGGDPGHDVTGAARRQPAPPNAYPGPSANPYPGAGGDYAAPPTGSYPGPPPYPYPWAAPQQAYAVPTSYVRKPRNPVFLGVVALFAFLPLGVASLIVGSRVDRRWAKGDVNGAVSAARLARNLAFAGIMCRVVWWCLSLLAAFVSAASG